MKLRLYHNIFINPAAAAAAAAAAATATRDS
jgi:hypothetical protein